jgi:hypothetical protein
MDELAMPGRPTVDGEVLARLSHLEPVLAGRRVLVLGDAAAAGASAAFLSGRGPAAIRTGRSEEGEPAGAFDCVVVHPEAGSPLTAGRVDALRALLAGGGLLAVAVLPAEAAAASLLRAAFPAVEALAIFPVAAWAVAPSRTRPGEVTWDGSRLASARPASLLFLCGERIPAISGATVLALPAGEAGAPPGHDLAAEAASERAAAREAGLAAEVLELSWERDRLAGELASARAAADALRTGQPPGDPEASDPGLQDLLPR